MFVKENQQLWVILDLFSISCSIVCLILDSILIGSIHFSTKNILDIKDNFDSYPIFDLSVTNNSCKSKSKLIIDIWPGTTQGCDCIRQAGFLPGNYERILYRGKCSTKIERYCEKIRPINEVMLTKWKGKEFCVETKDRNYTYYSLLLNSVKKNETCQNGFKQCGYLDSLNNIVCLLKDDECPINFIKVSTSENVPSECTSYNCKTINLDDGSILYYSNEVITGYVVSKFKVSDSNICLNVEEYDSNNVRYQLDYYSYYGCKTKYDNKKYDDRYKLLDSGNKYDFYDENGVIGRVIQLREYPLYDLKASTINLYHKPFSGFDLECLLNNKFKPKNIDNFENHTKNSRNLNISIIVFICINLVLTIYILIIRTLNGNLKDNSCYLWVSLMIYLIIFLLSVASYILTATVKQIGNECGDEYTRIIMKNVQKDLDKQEAYLVGISLIAIIAILLVFLDDFWSFFTDLCCDKCKKEVQKENVEMRSVENNRNNENNENNNQVNYQRSQPQQSNDIYVYENEIETAHETINE